MPSGTDINSLTLALVLTGAGVTVSAALIAAVIEILKRVGPLGTWIDAKREPGVAVVLSAALVGYAYLTTSTVDPITAFGAFLAFVGIAGLASKTHDVAATLTA
jgi:hypothetical protein